MNPELHLLISIQRAKDAGFNHLAEALLNLLKRMQQGKA